MSTKFTKAFEMKNLFMTAAVGALMLPTLGWSAADGRGHNGPDLAPTSIPVELDHGIKAKKVEEAMRVCYASGDANTGVISFLHRLADELTRGAGNGSTDHYTTYYYNGYPEDDFSFNPNAKEFHGVGEIIDGLKRDYKYLETKNQPDALTLRFCTTLGQNLTVNLKSAFCDEIDLKTPAPLPTVRYQSVVQDTGYDEFGREDKSESILTGVSINYDPAVYGTSVRLVNPVTGVKSAITINTVEYVECLKNELQKRAE